MATSNTDRLYSYENSVWVTVFAQEIMHNIFFLSEIRFYISKKEHLNFAMTQVGSEREIQK